MNTPDTKIDTRPALPDALQALVVKDHVHLGGLSQPQRLQALALIWASLPRSPHDERGINEALKAVLAGAAAFAATDHVELRRWLVDMGFLARDGYGRVYERVAFGSLPAAAKAAAEGLQGFEAAMLAAVCQALRAQHAARRRARHAAWAAQANVPAAE